MRLTKRILHKLNSLQEIKLTKLRLKQKKKKKDQEAKIVTWKSKKQTPTGRFVRHYVISEKPGPTKYSNPFGKQLIQ